MALVYSELRRLAHHYLAGERAGHTLQTTALVHEAYLRLLAREKLSVDSHGQFLAIAAQAMRRVLIDHARQVKAVKRDGGVRQTLTDATVMARQRPADLVDLDRALDELSLLDPRQGKVVELRFFGGLSVDETAAATGVSGRTVKRDWRVARAWLFDRLRTTSTMPPPH